MRTRPGRGVLGVIKQRFWSFTMVVGIGFLLLVSLAASAWLAALGKFFSYPDTVRDPCEVEQGQLLGLLSRQR